jgi:hypothetical protein
MIVSCSWIGLTASAYQESDEPAAPRWFVVVQVTATQRYTLLIFKTLGQKSRLLIDHAVPAAREKEMEQIVGTIVKQFDLPPLDEKGQIAGTDQPPAQVVFVIRQFTKNRRREVWFGRDEAERLGVQAALDKLIAIVNEQVGPQSTDADLREFQGVLKGK